MENKVTAQLEVAKSIVTTDRVVGKGKYEKLLLPFDDYWKNHLNEYSIQVSLYSLILEEWGFDIRGSYLVHIGPSQEAIIHKAVDLKEELRNYLPLHNF